MKPTSKSQPATLADDVAAAIQLPRAYHLVVTKKPVEQIGDEERFPPTHAVLLDSPDGQKVVTVNLDEADPGLYQLFEAVEGMNGMWWRATINTNKINGRQCVSFTLQHNEIRAWQFFKVKAHYAPGTILDNDWNIVKQPAPE